MGIENPVHLLFIAIVALVVLGPKRLPELARALGKGVREFREAISTDAPVHAEARVVETPAPAAPGPAAAAPAEPRDPAASSAAESPAAGAG
jgi:sec-independent protein translocase protein TatA